METVLNTLKNTNLNGDTGTTATAAGAGGVVGTGYSIQSLIQSLSLTGNIMIDSFIIMNLFTFMKEWGEIVIKFIISIAKSLFFGVSHYIMSYLKSKLTGRIVFRSEVKESNPLYKILFNNIIASNIEGDVQEDWKFKWLKIESEFNDTDTNYFQRMQNFEFYHNRPVELSIDYNSESDSKLQFSQTFGMSDKKVLIFKYSTKPSKKYSETFFQDVSRTFYIRINWIQSDSTNYKGDEHVPEKKRELSFDMILFDSPTQNITKAGYFQVFYCFLQERFNHIFDNMIFSYELKFTAAQDSIMYNYLYTTSVHEDNFRAVSEGWLKYGDDNTNTIIDIIKCGTTIHTDDIKQKDSTKIPKHNFVNMLTRPLNIEFDIRRNIQIMACGSDNTSNSKSAITRQTISRLLGIANIPNHSSTLQGYFQYKDKAIIIQQGNIVLLKKGQFITQDEIYDTFSYMVNQNIDRSKKPLTVTKKTRKQMSIYKWAPGVGDWEQAVLSLRSFDTIYLAAKFKASIIKEFDNFVRMEKLYRKVEVPYRKGIMFYGPPGTGKTSLVKAIAYEYQIPLYMIDVNGEGINDDTIVNILNRLGGNGLKILLFEDIDTAFADKEKMAKEEKYDIQYINPQKNIRKADKKHHKQGTQNDEHNDTGSDKQTPVIMQHTAAVPRKFLTYSGLLNAFDGVMSNQTGVITILTTNHIEKLGDAFIRPGRVDAKFELKECNCEQIDVMVRSFINKSCQLFEESKGECLENDEEQKKWDKIRNDPIGTNKRVNEFCNKLTTKDGESMFKPCEIQSYLLKYIDNLDHLFENYNELLQGRDPNNSNKSSAPTITKKKSSSEIEDSSTEDVVVEKKI
jgi:hypothetical protein